MPGPPFAFGAVLVIMALLVAAFMPENPHNREGKKQKTVTVDPFELKEEAGSELLCDVSFWRDRTKEIVR